MPLIPSELTDAMQEAFKTEWAAAKKTPMPEAGGQDRRLLFAAVARGLLEYVAAHQAEALQTITFEDVAGQSVKHTVTDTAINITTQ
jgi:hypothetical protein